jgi:ATP synthase protein I
VKPHWLSVFGVNYIPSKKGMSSRKDDKRQRFRQLNLLSAGLAFPVSIVIGYAIGYFLDRWLGTTFLKVVFLLFGIAAGFLTFYRTVVDAEKGE